VNPGDDDVDRMMLGFEAIALGNGQRLAACIAADGTISFWFVYPLNAIEKARAVHGQAADAAHEQLGPLPGIYQQRLSSTAPRCGRPRRDGRPCRIEVGSIGSGCHLHRDVAIGHAAAAVE
jgi:hypothetical protein